MVWDFNNETKVNTICRWPILLRNGRRGACLGKMYERRTEGMEIVYLSWKRDGGGMHYGILSQINVGNLVDITESTFLSGFVDNPQYMRKDRMWVYSGLNDTVVDTE